MKRVFVYEYLSGGGLMGADAESVDTLMPLGLSMRDAMAAGLMPLVNAQDIELTVACGPGVEAPFGHVNTATPELGESPFAFVARQAAMHDAVWLVAPETMGLLAEMAAVVGERKWLGCQVDAIRVASDKRATLALLGQHGVLTPVDFLHDAQTRRWVVKPNDGAGAVGAVVHDTLAAAQADQAPRQGGGEDLLLEPWVPGQAMSMSLLCGTHGVTLVSVNRQHIEINAQGVLSFHGVSPIVGAERDDLASALLPLAELLAKAMPGLRGFVGIDLVWHEQKGPVVIEVNPRITCAYAGLPESTQRHVASAILASHLAERHHGA